MWREMKRLAGIGYWAAGLAFLDCLDTAAPKRPHRRTDMVHKYGHELRHLFPGVGITGFGSELGRAILILSFHLVARAGILEALCII